MEKHQVQSLFSVFACVKNLSFSRKVDIKFGKGFLWGKQVDRFFLVQKIKNFFPAARSSTINKSA